MKQTKKIALKYSPNYRCLENSWTAAWKFWESLKNLKSRVELKSRSSLHPHFIDEENGIPKTVLENWSRTPQGVLFSGYLQEYGTSVYSVSSHKPSLELFVPWFLFLAHNTVVSLGWTLFGVIYWLIISTQNGDRSLWGFSVNQNALGRREGWTKWGLVPPNFF